MLNEAEMRAWRGFVTTSPDLLSEQEIKALGSAFAKINAHLRDSQ